MSAAGAQHGVGLRPAGLHSKTHFGKSRSEGARGPVTRRTRALKRSPLVARVVEAEAQPMGNAETTLRSDMYFKMTDGQLIAKLHGALTEINLT